MGRIVVPLRYLFQLTSGTGAPGASTAKAPPVMAREHYGVERQNFFVEAFEKEKYNSLNDMQEERLDQLTLNYMLNPKRNVKINSQEITL